MTQLFWYFDKTNAEHCIFVIPQKKQRMFYRNIYHRNEIGWLNNIIDAYFNE